MKRIHPHFIFLLLMVSIAHCTTSPGTFTEGGRTYSPDSTKFLLRYQYAQGAWDGGRTWFVAIVPATDSIQPHKLIHSYSSLDFDSISWNGNDTVEIAEKFTEYISQGKSNLRDTVINGATIHIVQRDPIDTSFTRKIFYQASSPNGKYELIVYKYVKPVNGIYFLNVSIINRGDSLPKFGNFYVSRYDFDCFTDIRWDSTSTLDCKVSEGCYHAFKDYLVKNRPAIPYKVQVNDTIRGNIQD